MIGTVDPQLTDAMFFVAMMAFTGAAKAILAAVTVHDTNPFSRLIATQRRRYSFLAFGQGVLAASGVWLLSLGSLSDIVAGAEAWRQLGLIGWVVNLGLALIVASPAITLGAMIAIYRNPAEMSHKRWGRNEFRPTDARRNNLPGYVRPVVVVDPFAPATGSYRNFVPV